MLVSYHRITRHHNPEDLYMDIKVVYINILSFQVFCNHISPYYIKCLSDLKFA